MMDLARYCDSVTAQLAAPVSDEEKARLQRDLEFAQKLQSIERRTTSFFDKASQLERLFGRVRAQVARNDALIKSREAASKRAAELRKAREASRIKATLRDAAKLRKSARWAKLSLRDRRRIDEAEMGCRRELAALQKVS